MKFSISKNRPNSKKMTDRKLTNEFKTTTTKKIVFTVGTTTSTMDRNGSSRMT